MRIFKRMLLQNEYKVVPSKEPNFEGTHIVLHKTRTLRGCNYQRVFKGKLKECVRERIRLEKELLVGVYK